MGPEGPGLHFEIRYSGQASLGRRYLNKEVRKGSPKDVWEKILTGSRHKIHGMLKNSKDICVVRAE